MVNSPRNDEVAAKGATVLIDGGILAAAAALDGLGMGVTVMQITAQLGIVRRDQGAYVR